MVSLGKTFEFGNKGLVCELGEDYCYSSAFVESSGYAGESMKMMRKRVMRNGALDTLQKKKGKKMKTYREKGYSVTDEEEDDDAFVPNGYMRNNSVSTERIREYDSTQRMQERKKKKRVMEQTCGICLSEEGKRTSRGKLSSCNHFFCFSCIVEWAKVESRCPICKLRFGTVTKIAHVDGVHGPGNVTHVPKRDQVYQVSEEEIRDYLDPYRNARCTECHQGWDDALMLLCDLCDSPSHTYCVGLGLEVPEGNWYCYGCRLTEFASSSTLIRSTGTNFYVTPQSTLSVTAQATFDPIPPPRTLTYIDSFPFEFGSFTTFDRWRIRRSGSTFFSSEASRGSRVTFPQETRLYPGTQRGVDQRNFCHQPKEFKEKALSYLEKKQVQSMVRTHMKSLSRNSDLDYYTFKAIARTSTHTILAALGIEHRSDEAYPTRISARNFFCYDAPCSGATAVPRCLFCFERFAKKVVKEIMHVYTYTPLFSRN